ncbi:PC4 domain-containing protein [Trichonephila clavipes]|nr:PC4 domain-containing protein [Trichonephila clavipes]
MVRASDSRSEVLGSMPPNTLRVHTEYVLVKSVGSKVLWIESRGQWTGEYFPPLQFHAEIGQVEIGSVAIYHPFGEFRRANSFCHQYGAQGLDQRQAVPLRIAPHATCGKRAIGCRPLLYLLVRLVEGEDRWEASDHLQGVLFLNWGGTKPHRTVTFNHETCYISRLLPSSSQRVCFDKDNGKASFKPDAVPENHFHLGSHNYAVVSDFADVARIHLRRYKLDATGSLLPTKDGITVTPSVWLALVREFSAIDQAFEDGKVFVIKDCLLLSRTVIENVTHIIMQSYFQRKDFTRKFLTPVSMLKETEWIVLKDIHKQITSKTVSIMFGRVFLKLLRQEVAKHIPFPKSDCVDCIDAEMVLTTSMVELLCNHIEENISSLFVCFGCLEGYENQLGHECMTYSNGQRISEYGDLAILNMDWDKLVADFVNRNIQMVNYMNEMFLNKLNMNVLIENAKQMYVARDSLLLL